MRAGSATRPGWCTGPRCGSTCCGQGRGAAPARRAVGGRAAGVLVAAGPGVRRGRAGDDARAERDQGHLGERDAAELLALDAALCTRTSPLISSWILRTSDVSGGPASPAAPPTCTGAPAVVLQHARIRGQTDPERRACSPPGPGPGNADRVRGLVSGRGRPAGNGSPIGAAKGFPRLWGDGARGPSRSRRRRPPRTGWPGRR